MSTLSSPTRSQPHGIMVPRIVGARECSARLVAAHGHAAHHAAIAGVIGPSGGRALRRAGTLTRSARNVAFGSRAVKLSVSICSPNCPRYRTSWGALVVPEPPEAALWVLRRSARGARKAAGEGGDQCALTPCRGRNGAEQLTPLGALEHRRPAGLHHVRSVRAHPMPVSWARRGRSQASRKGDRYRLMRSEGRFAESARSLEQSMPAPGMSRACPGRWQATARAPFCQTRQ
jgi:hypothetical protein